MTALIKIEKKPAHLLQTPTCSKGERVAQENFLRFPRIAVFDFNGRRLRGIDARVSKLCLLNQVEDAAYKATHTRVSRLAAKLAEMIGNL